MKLNHKETNMYALITNHGAQVGLYNTKEEASKAEDDFNTEYGSNNVFACYREVPNNTKPEDLPGRGFIYG